jgi:hypothetical protein
MTIERKITQQIAHCMAFYGDSPKDLMIKLEDIVLEWYIKGQSGFKINCPHCRGYSDVGHLEWDALMCHQCSHYVKIEDWKI